MDVMHYCTDSNHCRSQISDRRTDPRSPADSAFCNLQSAFVRGLRRRTRPTIMMGDGMTTHSQFVTAQVASPRHLMDARPRCTMHALPSQSRPNLFAGD